MDEELAIVFAPDLGISAEAFAEGWNAAPDAPGAAEAIYPKSVGYNIPPELIEQGMVFLSGAVTTAVATPILEAIGEIIKAKVLTFWQNHFPEKPQPKEVKINWVEDPQTGGWIAVVEGKAP